MGFHYSIGTFFLRFYYQGKRAGPFSRRWLMQCKAAVCPVERLGRLVAS